MITTIMTQEELFDLFAETLLNNTSKVTKISRHSALSGIGYGVGAVAQRAMKDIALVESHLLPENAFGSHLDAIAARTGVGARFGASGSSTYIRLVGAVGTTYSKGTHTFSGNHGIVFDLDHSVAIGSAGYTYAKVSSTTTGVGTNVDPLSITTINTAPAGHVYVINEYEATGGRDSESDADFRDRIRSYANIAARGTLAFIHQVMLQTNSDILRVFYQGTNSAGQSILRVATQNGADLSPSELEALASNVQEYVSVADLQPYGSSARGFVIENVQWQPVDISFRVVLQDNADNDEVRKLIQARISKYFDVRSWDANKRVEWDDLLQIVKATTGVKYVLDTFFVPNQDIQVDEGKIPRVRGFLMLDASGALLSGVNGTLNPFYYPIEADFNFQASILRTL